MIPRIAVCCDIDIDKNRDLVRAVLAAAHRFGRWELRLFGDPRRQVDEIIAWQPTGAVAQLSWAEFAQRMRAAVPALINVSNVIAVRGVPQVCNDDDAVGRLGVAHLREIGCQRLAFVGRGQSRYLEARWRSFRAAAGPGTQRIDLQGLATIARSDAVGLLCASDAMAAAVVDRCRQLGLAVPGAAAVLGIGDEEMFCFSCDPVLSSIPLSGSAIGRRAAELLADRLAGRRVPALTRIAPGPVAHRQSSERGGDHDPRLMAALEYLRAHAGEAVGIPDLLRAVQGSRRSLELAFRRQLGRSPHQELRRLRLERAQTLLATTDLPLAEVAARSGIAQAAHLCQLFRRFVGQSPQAWRMEQRRSAER